MLARRAVLGALAVALSGVVVPAHADPPTELTAKGGQALVGVARYTRTLTAHPGRWSVGDVDVTYQWRSGGRVVAGESGASYELRPEDVGHRIKVTITASAPGYAPAAVTESRGPVKYRVDVRRRVTYHVETRGHVTASVKEFKQLTQQTYDDPRGWRSSGIQFRPVAKGGSFTLVLAEASYLPRFSSQCSSSWSCRVGRFVVINQDRWLHASSSWNAAGGSLRDYRNMVVDHETGHWLGLHHVGCPGPGQPAPVMMQQSKGLQGCTFNPWPTPSEIAGRTPRA